MARAVAFVYEHSGFKTKQLRHELAIANRMDIIRLDHLR
jgi:hypothetical protein